MRSSPFVSERREAGTIPVPVGSGEQEEEEFLLVFVVVLISERFSPRAGEAGVWGTLSTQEPVQL